MNGIKISTNIYVGLGSNLGDRFSNITNAIQMLRKVSDTLTSSKLYETTPYGFSKQPAFLNSVCKLSTQFTPWLFLHHVKEIENNFQRHRVFTNSPRTIDIDILMWGVMVLESRLLTIPHPRFHERMFVLDPLFEISPTLMHPLLNLTVGEMRQIVQKKEALEIRSSPACLFQQIQIINADQEVEGLGLN